MEELKKKLRNYVVNQNPANLKRHQTQIQKIIDKIDNPSPTSYLDPRWSGSTADSADIIVVSTKSPMRVIQNYQEMDFN